MKVGLVIPTLEIGGAERQVVALARQASQDGCEMSILVMFGDSEHSLLSEARQSGARVVVSRFGRRDPRLLTWLIGMIHRLNLHVVQSFLWRSDARLVLASLISAYRPIVCSERGERTADGYRRHHQVYDRLLTFRRAAKVCANSRFGARKLAALGCPAEKLVLIPNGVDLEAIARVPVAAVHRQIGLPDSVPVVGYVGRLHPEKGVDTLLRAAQIVGRLRGGAVRFLLVGDGPQRRSLTALTTELGIQELVVFAGAQQSPIAMMKRCSLGVLPTVHSEACSNSVLEFMACSKPVVASSVGGNPELVVDGSTGRIVPPSRPDELAHAIVELLEDRELALEMGSAGRDRVRTEFDLSSIGDRYRGLWVDAQRS